MAKNTDEHLEQFTPLITPDVLRLIFFSAKPKDIAAWSRTSKAWYRLSNEDSLWRQKILESGLITSPHLNELKSNTTSNSMKECYLLLTNTESKQFKRPKVNPSNTLTGCCCKGDLLGVLLLLLLHPELQLDSGCLRTAMLVAIEAKQIAVIYYLHKRFKTAILPPINSLPPGSNRSLATHFGYQKNEDFGQNAFHQAALSGDHQYITSNKSRPQNVALICQKDSLGRHIFHLAAASARPDSLYHLARATPTLSLSDKDALGLTPLDYARFAGNEKLANWIERQQHESINSDYQLGK